MYRITAICDKCKKEEETQKDPYFAMSNDEWQEVEITIDQYTIRKYLSCIECRKKLGLYSKQTKSSTYTPTVYKPTVVDRLFEVISEIVQETKEG